MTEDACFNHGAAPGTIEELFDRVKRYYIELIDRIAARCPRLRASSCTATNTRCRPAQAVIGKSGWLKPALVAAKVPANLRAACIRYIIDQFSLRLADLQTIYAGRVVFVDSRGTLAPTDWANELHPTTGGFGKIARQKWKPALVGAGVL